MGISYSAVTVAHGMLEELKAAHKMNAMEVRCK
jgi:hypothetical protein